MNILTTIKNALSCVDTVVISILSEEKDVILVRAKGDLQVWSRGDLFLSQNEGESNEEFLRHASAFVVFGVRRPGKDGKYISFSDGKPTGPSAF